MNTFFGDPWPSGICDDGERVETPTGALCGLCDEPIEDSDRGSFMYVYESGAARATTRPAHRECSLRSVLGGWGHLTDHEKWCKRERDPDGGLTYRESALRVWAMQGGDRDD